MIVVPQIPLPALTRLDLQHSTTGSTQAWRRIDVEILDDSNLRQRSDHEAVIVSIRKSRY